MSEPLPAALLPAARQVLDFWFGEEAKGRWFERGDEFDALIRTRFEALFRDAVAGRLESWAATAEGALALLILLDQFSRNLNRGSPAAWANDEAARRIAGEAIARGFDRQVPLAWRPFFYLPFEHSESPEDQARSVALFTAWTEAQPPGPAREQASEQLRYVHRHAEIVERFGRFPHRNEILGRPSTPAELAFLQEPMSSF